MCVDLWELFANNYVFIKIDCAVSLPNVNQFNNKPVECPQKWRKTKLDSKGSACENREILLQTGDDLFPI